MRVLKKLQTAAARLADRLPVLPAVTRLADKIVLVDVGASQGIQRKWLAHRHNLFPVLFEPNAAEARHLQDRLAGFERSQVIEFGLSDKAGDYTLNIGKSYGCTSILTANMAFLNDYDVAQWFASERKAQVTCVRYDDLVSRGAAPAPDVIKVDVEGYESAVLDGFGDLLDDVLGIETEAWFYQGYQGQKLLHDLIARLSDFGLRLRWLETVPGFEGDLVCVNAYFTMQRKKYCTLSPARRAKFDVMSRVWRLAAYDNL